MKWIILIVVVILILNTIRNLFTGSHVASLYRKDPRAGFLKIAEHWLMGQPKFDSSKLYQCWTSISSILSRPDIVEQYSQFVALQGKVTGDTLTRAFTQFFFMGHLPDELAHVLDKCLKNS